MAKSRRASPRVFATTPEVSAPSTLAHPQRAEPALRAWLSPRALRLTSIELSHGASPHQTMITAWLPGPTEDAIRQAHAMRAGLAPLGIEVTRIKLELSHRADATLVQALYLEHHVKVRTAKEELAALARLGEAHGAHLSRNPRRVLDGVEYPALAAGDRSAWLDRLARTLRLVP